MRKVHKQVNHFFKNRVIMFGLAVVILLSGYAIYSNLGKSIGINLVDSEYRVRQRVVPSGDAKTCYYKQVTCVSEPCEPILICSDEVNPSPSTQPEVCTQAAGRCVGVREECASYTDSCMKSRVCATPFQVCGVKPSPSVTPSPSPRPTTSSYRISNFQAANPCGTAHFYNYQVTCNYGLTKDISQGRCLPLSIALENAHEICNY